MKLLSIFLICFSINLANAWEENSFTEDSNYQYWTGISSPKDSESEALTEAYDNALNESIKYNFGFKHKLTESSFQNIDKTNMYKENYIETPSVQFKNVLPFKQKIVKIKEKFVAYRNLRLEKKSILIEQGKISEVINKNKDFYNLVIENNQGNKLGKITINTNPINTEIKLVPHSLKSNNKEFYLGTSNTEFIIPIGEYSAEIISSGYKMETRKIIVSGLSEDLIIKMEPVPTFVEFNVHPRDSKIYLNNKLVNNFERIEVLPNDLAQIKIMHDDYFEESFNTSFLANDYKIIRNQLSAKKSSFKIITNPSDAKVFANGIEIGFSPILNYEINSSKVDFVIIKKGYNSISKTIQIKPNFRHEPIEVNLIPLISNN